MVQQSPIQRPAARASVVSDHQRPVTRASAISDHQRPVARASAISNHQRGCIRGRVHSRPGRFFATGCIRGRVHRGRVHFSRLGAFAAGCGGVQKCIRGRVRRCAKSAKIFKNHQFSDLPHARQQSATDRARRVSDQRPSATGRARISDQRSSAQVHSRPGAFAAG